MPSAIGMGGCGDAIGCRKDSFVGAAGLQEDFDPCDRSVNVAGNSGS